MKSIDIMYNTYKIHMRPWGRSQKGGWAHGPRGPGPWPMGPRPGFPAAFLGLAPWAHMYFVRMLHI